LTAVYPVPYDVECGVYDSVCVCVKTLNIFPFFSRVDITKDTLERLAVLIYFFYIYIYMVRMMYSNNVI
jgi:hypothetical protein